MNDRRFESLHVYSMLTDIEILSQAFGAFHNVKSYSEFHTLVGGLLDSFSVLYVNPTYGESKDGDVKWLKLSTGCFSHNYSEVGLSIAFDYSCSFTTNNTYLCHRDSCVISMNGKICTLDEVIDNVMKIAYPSEQKDSICC